MQSRALVFIDVVDSTLTVERVGDARAAALWTAHDRRARDLLVRHAGREIDRSDGFFLLFDDAVDAARYALAYQATLTEFPMKARVGVHVGPVTLRDNTAEDVARGAKPLEVEGLAKPFTARLMALAGGGQILLSGAARDAVAGAMHGRAEITGHGHYRFKGMTAPVEVFELGVRGASPFAPPDDGEKAYRVILVDGNEGDDTLWRPVRDVRHSLPAERDAFVGRTVELRALADRLEAGVRLVTIVGPGGTGKTRFVRRYCWTWLGDWPGGVYFCDLSEARSVEGIVSAVAVAFGVPLGKTEPVVQLGHAIEGRGRCLVVLDNFEQVVQHAQATVGRWLDRAALASFVVTSRERLNLRGEETVPLEPLPLATEAVELFALRARAQKADFRLTEANRATIERIVGLLDGLPLAIELAAARVRLLSPTQLVERLQHRFRLLAGSGGVASRQATLRAAIDWSWDLLAPWEQSALAQCSVFEGGFTLDAAEHVLDLSPWPDAPMAMDAVQALVDKSLLRTWTPVEQRRHDFEEHYFGMYLTIHEYASDRLRALGATLHRDAEARHGDYFAAYGSDDAIAGLSRTAGWARLRALALELDNLVAACRRAVAEERCETAVGNYRAVIEVLIAQGPFDAGVALGDQVLAMDGCDVASRLAGCVAHGRVLQYAGRMDDAAARLTEALTIAERLGDRHAVAHVLVTLTLVRRMQGRMDDARIHAKRALSIAREAGERNIEGAVHAQLGILQREQGAMADVQAHYVEALALHRSAGDRASESRVLGNLANFLAEQRRYGEAQTHFEEALAIAREIGNRALEGLLLGNLGALHADIARLDEARVFYAQALAIHRDMGNRREEGIVLGNQARVHQLRGRLDEAQNDLDTALAYSRDAGDRRHEGHVLDRLGALLAEQGRPEEALTYFEAALPVHRAVGNARSEAAVLAQVSDLEMQRGRTDAARDALEQAEARLRDVGDAVGLIGVLCMRGRHRAQMGDDATARASLEEAEAIAMSSKIASDTDLGREIDALRALLA